MLVRLSMSVRRNTATLSILAIFAASEILARALGIRFAAETLGTLYQYLDPEILREDLARGLYYLHAQPPLFNFGLGLTLELFPDSFARAFSLSFGAMAMGLLFLLLWTMRRLGAPAPLAVLVCLAFALSPNFLVYRHWLFYTLPVALLLLGSAGSLLRFLETGRGLWLAVFLALAGALMLTRSVFHPLWLVFALAAVLPFAPRAKRRALAIGSLVPLAIVNLWFLKNGSIVGSYSGSSWLGLSLTKRWPLSQDEVKALKDEGVLPPYWNRRPFMDPEEYAPFGFFAPGPLTHPALDHPFKSNGEPNFNHRDYARISNELFRSDLHLLRRYPGRYLERVLTSLLLYLQPGPNSVHFLVDYDFDRVHRYRDLLTRYVFLGGVVSRPIRMLDPRPNLMLLGFPVLVAVGFRGLARGSSELRALQSYMLASVLWVTAIANLVEIGENDRMRWEIEPFLAIWLALVATALSRRLSSSSEAGTA